MSVFDFQQTFFNSVWRRIVLIVVCFGWALFEFVTAAPFWGVLFGALGTYAVWQLFLTEWTEAGDAIGEPAP